MHLLYSLYTVTVYMSIQYMLYLEIFLSSSLHFVSVNKDCQKYNANTAVQWADM